MAKSILNENSDDEVPVKYCFHNGLFHIPTFFINLISAHTAEVITIQARSNVTENQVETLKRDGEGKTN